MDALLTAVFLHAGLDAPLELAGMILPFAGILGFGMYLIVPEILKAQGERYQYREHGTEVQAVGSNGHAKRAGPENGSTPAGKVRERTDTKLGSNN